MMFDKLKAMLGVAPQTDNAPLGARVLDKELAAAALMVHVIAADGVVTDAEEARLDAILRDHYAISPEDARRLATEGRAAQGEATDLYGFTAILKRDMDEAGRMHLVEDLWEMVYADGEIHEFEDNVVWRVAELLGIHSRHRMTLKQRVRTRLEADGTIPADVDANG